MAHATLALLSGARGFLALLLAGLALRLLVAWASVGTNDVLLWQVFAARIAQGGLLGRYGEIEVQGFVMNHPPLAAWGAVGVRRVALATGVGFPLLFKLPAIAADLGIAALLGWLAGREGRPSLALTAAYAASPLAIGISAYHGNTDCIATALALASAALLARARPAASGLALAAALNVKLVPILLLPALLLQCRDLRAARRFAAAFACGLLPFAPFVAAQPLGFYRATLGLGSEWNLWGPLALLHFAGRLELLPPLLAPLAEGYRAGGVALLLLLVGAASLAARRRPHRDPITASGVCLGLLLAVAPGFGLQYLVYPLPFLLLADLRFGLAWSILAGVFAIAVYASCWTGVFPLYSLFEDGGFPMPTPLLGLAAWAVLVAWLLRALRPELPART